MGFDRARDILWTLIGWEVYELLVIERGWSLADWEAWVAESTASLLLREQARTVRWVPGNPRGPSATYASPNGPTA